MLDATTKELLNKFAETQPALNVSGKPAAIAGIKLGDLLASAFEFEAASAANWDGAAPESLREAVQRLEAAVAGLLGAAIP